MVFKLTLLDVSYAGFDFNNVTVSVLWFYYKNIIISDVLVSILKVLDTYLC